MNRGLTFALLWTARVGLRYSASRVVASEYVAALLLQDLKPLVSQAFLRTAPMA
jgi:hypothetical protein